MTLHSCPVCLMKFNGGKMKEHLRTRHPKHALAAGAASRAVRSRAAARLEEWVACGVCGRAERTRGDLLQHIETEHVRSDSPHNIHMNLADGDYVRSIKGELKRTSKECGWMEHMYVDKTINRCKGTVGQPYTKRVGQTKVRVTKLCPASILVEPHENQFRLTFYNQHMGHDNYTYKPSPFSSTFVVTKQNMYEKVIEIFDRIKKHALNLSVNDMERLLKKAEDTEVYVKSMSESVLQPIEEVLISSDLDPLETPTRKRKLPSAKTVINVVEKAVDEALEKYIKAKNPVLQIKHLDDTQQNARTKNANTPTGKSKVQKIEPLKPKIVNTFSLSNEDEVENFVNDVELLVNNGKSYEVTERRRKLGKVNFSDKKDLTKEKVKTFPGKIITSVQTPKIEETFAKRGLTVKKVNANGKKVSSQSLLNDETSNLNNEVADKKKGRMTTRKSSINLSKDDVKGLNTRRLSVNVEAKHAHSQSMTESLEAKKVSTPDRNSIKKHTNISNEPLSSESNTQNAITIKPIKDVNKSADAKKSPKSINKPIIHSVTDAKKKATEDEGNRLANETVKLGNELVKVSDLVDDIISPKKKMNDIFSMSTFNDSYKKFITKEFKVTPAKKPQKKSLPLEVNAKGINQSDRQIPDNVKELVKMNNDETEKNLKEDIFTDLLNDLEQTDRGEGVNDVKKKGQTPKSEKVTNDMLIELLSEPNAASPTKPQPEVKPVIRKGRPPKKGPFKGKSDMSSVNDHRVMISKASGIERIEKPTKRTFKSGKVSKTGLKSRYPISKPQLKMAATKATKSLNRRSRNSVSNPGHSEDEATEGIRDGEMDSVAAGIFDSGDSLNRSTGLRNVVEEKFIVKERKDDCNILIIRM